MKKYLMFALLFTCFTLCGSAGVRYVNFSHLEKAKMSPSLVKKPHADHSMTAGNSLQTNLHERNLSSNPLARKSLRDFSPSDFIGTRIAAMELYDYLEDGSVDSICTNVGWEVQLNPWYDDEEGIVDDVYCMTDYSDFYTVNYSTIPVGIDYESRQACLYFYEVISYGLSQTIGNVLHEKIISVYLLPEEFLYDDTGDEWPEYIEGAVYDDGTVAFGGGFVYYTQQILTKRRASNNVLISSDTVYSVSPVYRNLCLLIPNGVHNFTTSDETHSGLTSSSANQTLHLETVFARDKDFDVVGTSGYGGAIGTPIDPRPIKPGKIWHGDGNLRGQSPGINGNRTRLTMSNGTYSVPVYMYQADDGTLYVYNLYGSGLVENHMVLSNNGTMSFPGQQIGFDSESNAGIFNCMETFTGELSRWSITLGNVGVAAPDSVTWDATSLYTENGLMDYKYENNALYFTNGEQFVIPGPDLPPLTPGDANNDGDITLLDVVVMIDHLLSDDFDPNDGFNLDAADVNEDGAFSVLDVSLLIDQLLSAD